MKTNQSNNYKILIVDDEPANLRLLERLFRRDYQVIAASSGAEALELLEMHDVAVIISDQRMQAMTGIEFLKRAAEMRPHTARIILTGYTDINSLVEAINSGSVYKYVSKPWVNEDLQQTVVRAIEHYGTIKSQYQLKLQNSRLLEQLELSKNGFVRFVAEALDAQNENLLAHLRRTSHYAVAVGQRFGLETAELENLALAGFLHRLELLFAPRKVPNENAATINQRQNDKLRIERASRLLANFPGLEDVVSAVRHHNEYFDGSSDGNFSGERLPLFARIVAAAAAYDRLIAPPDASKALTHEQAVGKLQNDAGTRFDPSVVAALAELESVSRIQQVLAEGVIVMRLLQPHLPCDADQLSTAELLQKFKTEPMLAMDVLYAANTTGFDSEPTARLMAAMSAVGEDTLRSIINQYGLPPNDERTKAVSQRGVRRAVAAQMLTAHTEFIHPDEAYTLGLLYDVGETLLHNLFPDEVVSLEHFDEKMRPRRQVELFGVDAAQISRQLLEICGVSPVLASAVENRQNAMSVSSPLALLLHIADVIAVAESVGKTSAMNAVGADMLEDLNLSRADLNKIYERANFISEERVVAPEQILELVG